MANDTYRNPPSIEYRSGQLVFLNKGVLTALLAVDTSVPHNVEHLFCLIIADPHKAPLFWAIPITSSNPDAYRKRALQHPRRFKWYPVKGRPHCFNLSKMFPISVDDIHNPYMKNGTPLTLKPKEIDEVARIVTSLKTPASLNEFLHYHNVADIVDNVHLREKKRRPTQ